MNAPDRTALKNAWGTHLAALGLAPILGVFAAGGVAAQSADSAPRPATVKIAADDNGKDEDKVEARENKDQELAERWEHRLRNLRDRFAEEMGPAGEEVRKAWDRAVARANETLQEDGISADSVHDAIEDLRDELAESFESGSPLDRRVRRALDRLNRELSEAGEAARRDLQETVHRLYTPGPDAGRSPKDEKDLDKPKEKAKDGEGKNQQEIETARKEVHELQQSLHKAIRRLHELERDRLRGEHALRGPGPHRGPSEERHPGPGHGPGPADGPRPKSDQKPEVKPETGDASPHHDGEHHDELAPGPRGPRGGMRGPRGGMMGPRGGEFRRGPGQGPGGPFPGMRPGGPNRPPRPDNDRIRELENKMDQLLKQLDRLKDGDDDGKSSKKTDSDSSV